jgi:serine-type D-Ala-D-Ala carboxypeptidase/endopeptidase
MRKLFTLSFFLVTTLSLCLGQTISEEIKTHIKARVDNGIPAIVIGVADEKGVQYFSYGVKSVKTKEPVNENSVFEIGSITKTFTGILLADKVLKKEVALDDPLQKYLPAGVTAPTRNGGVITLVHLSNHTSSLPRMPANFRPADPSNPFADYSEKQMWDFLTQVTLPRDIGSQYEYSNFAVGMLGHVLAAKSGLSYEQLLINVIANPLGLQSTRITLTPDMQKNLAKGHVGNIEVSNWDIPTLAGAGAIRSTAVDMIKYLSANMGATKTSLYPAMQLSHKNTRPEGSKPMVGLGWHKMPAGDREIIWHNGGTGGYRTFIGFLDNGSKAVVVLSNSATSIDDIGNHLLNPASPLKELAKSLTVEPAVLETYVGTYQLAPGFILTISREETQLKAQATGQAQFPVFAKANNVFFYKVVEAELVFNSNKDGVVESVTLKQGGQEIVGKKL